MLVNQIHAFSSYKKRLIRNKKFEFWTLRHVNGSMLFSTETRTPKILKKGHNFGKKYEKN